MIDRDRLDELHEEIGEDDLGSVVSVFLDETDEVISGLGPGLSAAELEAQLHFLKGSALNLGLRAFAALCQQGERAAGLAATTNGGAPQPGRAAGFPVDLDELARVYTVSRDALLAALSRGAAGGGLRPESRSAPRHR
ncbi:Hpt domain-containing protein [Pseudogemmobacter sonorensis]|uniref:Hpt domain-containing protein n=1 Tax=Pseudogemmobacter sonorensis TaxID=2989681 RepID=UPI0036803373